MRYKTRLHNKHVFKQLSNRIKYTTDSRFVYVAKSSKRKKDNDDVTGAACTGVETGIITIKKKTNNTNKNL